MAACHPPAVLLRSISRRRSECPEKPHTPRLCMFVKWAGMKCEGEKRCSCFILTSRQTRMPLQFYLPVAFFRLMRRQPLEAFFASPSLADQVSVPALPQPGQARDSWRGPGWGSPTIFPWPLNLIPTLTHYNIGCSIRTLSKNPWGAPSSKKKNKRILIVLRHLTKLHHVTMWEGEYVAPSHRLLPSVRFLKWFGSSRAPMFADWFICRLNKWYFSVSSYVWVPKKTRGWIHSLKKSRLHHKSIQFTAFDA